MPSEPAVTIRNVATVGWQVLLSGDQWHTCRKEQDARYIANGVLIADSVAQGERVGEEVARELDEVASMVSRQIGECEALQLMKAAAATARGEVFEPPAANDNAAIAT
ncbi:hypothetical protein [Lacipirellula parvula]|uniref:Uncharacterized protein n=1 Tax=Lacipirellula parvula TaxID=2650471 RepID=A0A5K7XAP4_9BACT|nr:hypothetical protein [Lacipirellula parvula]BBO33037.1 hypothetical protein PLANPX_2649 [Lacipirellula parvula]